jgi:uroporphyrinogen decarboxylase
MARAPITPKQRTDVRRCVRQAHDNPKGLIVATGCSLPVETPFAKDAMIDAAREIGWPVNAAELVNAIELENPCRA